MRVIRGSLLLLLIGILGCLLSQAPATAGPKPSADDQDKPGRLVLLLDSSGSMKEPAAGGTTKIEAAKQALDDVTRKLPDDAEVGVRVFGATVEDRSQPGACTDTQNVVPVGPLDRSAIDAAVAKYKPYGETPIGSALRGAARDLGPARDGQQRTIVLLSDGEPTCAPDPCKVARQLRQQGIDLQINVVGLDVASKARSALQCIARAGGGRYFDASNAEELSDSLVQVSVRPLRRFSVNGERVTGGTSTAEPAEVEPGDYVDRSLPDDQPRYYLLDVPDQGGVSAAVVMRPDLGDRLVGNLQVQLRTVDGDQCASDLSQTVGVLLLRSILSAAAFYSLASDDDAEGPCRSAKQLLVQVSFNGPPAPYELHLRGYPEVTDYASLPAPVPDNGSPTPWTRPVRLSGPGTPVVGGASLADAPVVRAGTTYADTLRPREELIYAVEVPWGQSPRMTARLETDPAAARAQGLPGVAVSTRCFNALDSQLQFVNDAETGMRSSGFYSGDQPVTLAAGFPPVRLRNVESTSSEVAENSWSGRYHCALEMGGDSDRTAERFAAPVRIAFALDGQPSGEPRYEGEVKGASPSPSPSAKAAEKSDGDTGGASTTGHAVSTRTIVLLVLAAVLVVAAVAAAGFAFGRRRR